jgi:hypothetical protein
MSALRLKEDYSLARCCSPSPPDPIVGYYSWDNVLRVHRSNCANLARVEPERLVTLDWEDILAEAEPSPEQGIIETIDSEDIAVLRHHRMYGIDYSLKIARLLGLDKQRVFDIHQKLRDLGLLERVEPRIVQYRKGHVKGKWIKHRNHTYYDLTDRGRLHLEYLERSS